MGVKLIVVCALALLATIPALYVGGLVEDRTQRAADVVISASIIVERESQRAIVLGKGGAMIREVGTRARAAIGELLQRPAHLKLFVKIQPDWTTSPQALAELGYRA